MKCNLGNITVHYEVIGKGFPIIILPAWGISGRFTAHWLEPFFQQQPGFKRFYVDPPGHGGTAGPMWITNQDDMLQVLLKFIDKTISGQRFLIAGVSLGAYLARGVLYYRRTLIDGLLLMAPVIVAKDKERTTPPHVVIVEDQEIVSQLPPAAAEFLKTVVVRSKTFFEQMQTYPTPREGQAGDPVFLENIRQQPEKYAFSFNLDVLSEPFPKPTLVICGRQDSAVGYEDAWRILPNYPRATFIMLDRAGHLLEETEDVVGVLINKWLDRVIESKGGTTQNTGDEFTDSKLSG